MKNNSNFENISTFDFKKSLVKIFLTDKNLLSALVKDANVKQDDCVLEIGVGAGALTEVLVKTAKKLLVLKLTKNFVSI